MMNIDIVDNAQATWQDLKTLRLEALKNNPTAFGRSYEETVDDSDEKWKEKLNGQSYYFARDNHEFVGMISYYRHEGAKTNHLFGICAFYVRPAFQSQGVGRRLLEQVLTTIKSLPEAHKIKIFGTVGNDRATKLYESAGFRLVGIQKDELRVDGQFYDEMEFEMVL